MHTIERNGTGIERNGTGIQRSGTGVERSGTGLERSGTGIRGGGTGSKRGRHGLLAAVAMLGLSAVSAPTLAQNLPVFGAVNENLLTLSVHDGRTIAAGGLALHADLAWSTIELTARRLGDEEIQLAGSGTGDHGDSAGIDLAGSGTGQKGDSDAGIDLAGSGTGQKGDSGEGIELGGSGTGTPDDGHSAGGQFLQLAGSGTGSDEEGDAADSADMLWGYAEIAVIDGEIHALVYRFADGQAFEVGHTTLTTQPPVRDGDAQRGPSGSGAWEESVSMR